MGVAEDLADVLARDTITAMEKHGNDRLYIEVSKVLGESSTTLQEAYLTAVRVRLAERRGRAFLDAMITAAETGSEAPKAPRAPDAGH